MSDAPTPSGSPVNPPIPNMGRNANAKSMGVVKRIEAPQSEIKNAVKIATEGMEMIMVVVWKKALMACPIPVRNMWCAQTMKDINPRKTREYTSVL